MGVLSGYGAVVHNNKMWVISKGNVWHSTDGKNWNKATGNTPWSGGSAYAVVFKNKIWVIVGTRLWNSANGVNWTQATDNTGWGQRGNFGAVVYNNKIWVMGGKKSTGVMKSQSLHDVWNSKDGNSWKKVSDAADWKTRANFSSLVYNKKIWVIAGGHIRDDGKTIEYLGDSWYYSEPTGIQNNGITLHDSKMVAVKEAPGNRGVYISFQLPKSKTVKIDICDILGRRIKSVLNRTMQRGNHTILWNKSGDNNESVARGHYFLHFKSDNSRVTEKFIVLN